VRLLFDQNLSYRLVELLSEAFPDSTHVRFSKLETATDAEIWDFAVREHVTIVSKDSDFRQRCLVFGPPPKVIWIRVGNCSTDTVAQLMRRRRLDLERFESDPETAFLILD
jgi:predicted nuclease of predicted toxin-antitoxin system